MIKEWKDLFRLHILERGLDYFSSGAVTSVEQTEDGYQAIVEGTEEYQVEIEIQDNRISEMFCDCPYAEDGNYCKHMAAVLFEIEAEEMPASNGGKIKTKESRQELESVINSIPEAEVKRLLAELAWEDESLRNRILTAYSEDISEQQMIRLKKEVNSISYQYSDRYGFVDYRNASHYTSALERFMDDKVQSLIDNQYYQQAFELVNHVFYTLGNQDMDDSDGGTGYVANICYEFWQQILEEGGEENKAWMFQWFKEHQDGYVIDYMQEYIEDFLMNEFHDPDLLKQKLEMLDGIIARAGDKTDCGKLYSSHYGYENVILKRLQIMKELGSSEYEIWEYRKKYRKFSAIRKLEVQEYLEQDNYEEAVRVLQESKELDQAYPSFVSEYSRQLIDIYKKTEQKADYRKELEYQIFKCQQGSLDYIKLLKELCGETEWQQYREKILGSKTTGSVKYRVLEEEGLYDRLLREILSVGSIYNLNQYEKVLAKKYPEEVRDAYIDYVRKYAESASSRNQYKEVMGYLKKIVKYPDGKSITQKIAGKWRELYRRRPAMMDELRKAGF